MAEYFIPDSAAARIARNLRILAEVAARLRESEADE